MNLRPNLRTFRRVARLSGGKLLWEDGAEWARYATHGTAPVAHTARDSVQVSAGKTVIRGPNGKSVVLNQGDDVRHLISASFHIPADEQHLLLEHAPNDASGDTQYRVEWKMAVQTLRFTQSSIRPFFRDGRSIYALLNDLHSGGVDPLRDLEPLRISWYNEAWRSHDNRRLWALKCFSAMNCQGPKVCVRVNVCPVTDDFHRKHTTTNDGVSVLVTG